MDNSFTLYMSILITIGILAVSYYLFKFAFEMDKTTKDSEG